MDTVNINGQLFMLVPVKKANDAPKVKAKRSGNSVICKDKADVLAYVAEHPGQTRRIVSDNYGGARGRGYKAIQKLVSEGKLRLEPCKHHGFLVFLPVQNRCCSC